MKEYLLQLSVLLFILAGCSETPIMTNTDSTKSYGTIVGRIRLNDVYYAPLPDHSGATVQLEGTTLYAITDSTGTWSIDSIPSGIYVLKLSKDGFVTKKIFNVNLAGPGTLYLNYQQQPTILELKPTYYSAHSLVLRGFETKTYQENYDSLYVDSAGDTQ